MSGVPSETLLKRWLKRTRESQLAHYAAAERYSALHLWIGVPAASFSAIVGTAVFATLDSNEHIDIRLRVALGLISVLAAILTGCQTFLRFSERADQHRSTAVRYSALRRTIEANLTFPTVVTATEVDQIRKSFDQISTAAPNVSMATWQRATRHSGHDYLYQDK